MCKSMEEAMIETRKMEDAVIALNMLKKASFLLMRFLNAVMLPLKM